MDIRQTGMISDRLIRFMINSPFRAKTPKTAKSKARKKKSRKEARVYHSAAKTKKFAHENSFAALVSLEYHSNSKKERYQRRALFWRAGWARGWRPPPASPT